ncbi:sigma factor [Lentzea sp. CA-135723]|uniref:sigma factor n=1 Tax=Lentzea sp. CA-135723 TaxID=3239950 RepID=UPI003D8A9825
MSDLLAAAQTGGHDAFGALVTPHLRALHLYRYRMPGSYSDADEALQDTFVRVWRSFGMFEGGAPCCTGCTASRPPPV